MNKRKHITIGGIIFLIAIFTVISGFRYYQIELITDSVTLELGEPLNFEASKYVKGNTEGTDIDFSAVNIKKTGIYNAYASNKTKRIAFSIEVIDTTPPTAERLDGLKFLTNNEVRASELVTNLKDSGTINITFVDGRNVHIYSEGADINETIILSDESGNETKIDVVFQIIADKTNPIIDGIKPITIYVGERIDFLSGVNAVDDRDGDITKDISVSMEGVNLERPGKYFVLYSVNDSSGNKVVNKRELTVIEDKAPELKGFSNKTVYINEKINYLKGITAEDDRDGDLTKNIQVDSSNVNLKSAGTYTVVYSVVDEAGNKTNKTITLTVNNKKTNTTNTENSVDVKKNSNSNTKTNTNTNKKSSNGSSGGFEFFDVEPEKGSDVDGHIDPGGGEVGTWG